MSPRVAFISGPTDAPETYFSDHYKRRILDAIANGDSFVLGPVEGIDTLALHFLMAEGVSPSQITVYLARFEYNNSALRQRFQDLGVNVVEAVAATTTGERDAAMTAASDYDILRYRSEEECKTLYGPLWYPRVSNTEMNERRREALKEGRNLDRSYHHAGNDAAQSTHKTKTKKKEGRLSKCTVS
jgi:hypothetical protein